MTDAPAEDFPRGDPVEDAARADRLVVAGTLIAQGRLLRGAVHELNNVFTTLLLATQSLDPEAMTPDCQEMVQAVRRAGEAGQALVQSLSGLAVPSPSGDSSKSCDLRDVLDEVRELLGPTARRCGVVINDHVRSGLRIHGPRSLVAALLVHLLDNAIRAAGLPLGSPPPPEGSLSEIMVLASVGQHATIAVVDQGPGVASPIPRERPWQPFVSTRSPGDGTGLGLPVADAIVQRLGGRFQLRNRSGGGTLAQVELPLERVSVKPSSGVPGLFQVWEDEHGIPDMPEPPDWMHPGKRARLPILILDDEPDMAELIADVLRTQGFPVTVYTDPIAALDAELDAALVIADFNMPTLSGPAFLQHLRRRLPEVRALFITGEDLAPGSLPSAPGSTPPPVLRKPFATATLLRMVANTLAEPKP